METLTIDTKLITQFKQDKNKENLLRGFLWQLAHHAKASQGIIYSVSLNNEQKEEARFVASYAFTNPKQSEIKYVSGEGFVGQSLQDKKELIVQDIPANYLTIVSGLGKSDPAYLLILPLFNENGNVFSIIELASFKSFPRTIVQQVKNAAIELYNLINS